MVADGVKYSNCGKDDDMFMCNTYYPIFSYCGEFEGDRSRIPIIVNLDGFRMSDPTRIRIG